MLKVLLEVLRGPQNEKSLVASFVTRTEAFHGGGGGQFTNHGTKLA